MGGVDKEDQMTVYYSFQRKSIKWWKKVFFWLLEVSVINSYHLYRQCIEGASSHLMYRRVIIKGLLEGAGEAVLSRPRPGRRSVDHPIERMNDKTWHFPATGKKRRHCRVCRDRATKYHTTNTFCRTCTDQPYLHADRCFEVYHTKKNPKRHAPERS